MRPYIGTMGDYAILSVEKLSGNQDLWKSRVNSFNSLTSGTGLGIEAAWVCDCSNVKFAKNVQGTGPTGFALSLLPSGMHIIPLAQYVMCGTADPLKVFTKDYVWSKAWRWGTAEDRFLNSSKVQSLLKATATSGASVPSRVYAGSIGILVRTRDNAVMGAKILPVPPTAATIINPTDATEWVKDTMRSLWVDIVLGIQEVTGTTSYRPFRHSVVTKLSLFSAGAVLGLASGSLVSRMLTVQPPIPPIGLGPYPTPRYLQLQLKSAAEHTKLAAISAAAAEAEKSTALIAPTARFDEALQKAEQFNKRSLAEMAVAQAKIQELEPYINKTTITVDPSPTTIPEMYETAKKLDILADNATCLVSEKGNCSVPQQHEDPQIAKEVAAPLSKSYFQNIMDLFSHRTQAVQEVDKELATTVDTTKSISKETEWLNKTAPTCAQMDRPPPDSVCAIKPLPLVHKPTAPVAVYKAPMSFVAALQAKQPAPIAVYKAPMSFVAPRQVPAAPLAIYKTPLTFNAPTTSAQIATELARPIEVKHDVVVEKPIVTRGPLVANGPDIDMPPGIYVPGTGGGTVVGVPVRQTAAGGWEYAGPDAQPNQVTDKHVADLVASSLPSGSSTAIAIPTSQPESIPDVAEMVGNVAVVPKGEFMIVDAAKELMAHKQYLDHSGRLALQTTQTNFDTWYGNRWKMT
ncbi:MAG: hypothetical protein P4L69_11935, partial [Desulfosporosinus sp.]|nr:hypothetical protein [Desulfosporosinus sp.]